MAFFWGEDGGFAGGGGGGGGFFDGVLGHLIGVSGSGVGGGVIFAVVKFGCCEFLVIAGWCSDLAFRFS